MVKKPTKPKLKTILFFFLTKFVKNAILTLPPINMCGISPAEPQFGEFNAAAIGSLIQSVNKVTR